MNKKTRKCLFFYWKMNDKRKIHQAKKQGPPNQGSLQAYIQNFTLEAIDALVEILRTTRNESLKMGAAKVIIDKSIADIKAIELSGKDGSPIRVQLINDYLSTSGVIVSPSKGSSTGQNKVQDAGLASESEENIDSPGENSSGGTQSAP